MFGISEDLGITDGHEDESTTLPVDSLRDRMIRLTLPLLLSCLNLFNLKLLFLCLCFRFKFFFMFLLKLLFVDQLLDIRLVKRLFLIELKALSLFLGQV